ncbi:hypothetical protein FGB62_2g212 [Gracilaria domingensis]|nr:hypothetical protein FGB62_2g212 [Gracilaria domingensis]
MCYEVIVLCLVCAGILKYDAEHRNRRAAENASAQASPEAQSSQEDREPYLQTRTPSPPPHVTFNAPGAGTPSQTNLSIPLTVPEAAVNDIGIRTGWHSGWLINGALSTTSDSSNVRDVNSSFSDMLSFKASEKDRRSACPVCLDELGERNVSTGQCLHLIHTDCLKQWLVRDRHCGCPVCRFPYDGQGYTNVTS